MLDYTKEYAHKTDFRIVSISLYLMIENYFGVFCMNYENIWLVLEIIGL